MKKNLIVLIAALFSIFTVMNPVAAAESGAKKAVDYLEFYKVFDGRCMGLMRGDMRMVRNTHPEKTIEYRLMPYLGERRQVSLVAGTIEPGEEGQKLGCEKLEGLEQVWKVARANFME